MSKLNERLVSNIKEIIETGDETQINAHEILSSVIFYSQEKETELELAVLNNHSIIISRVMFENQRRGTMTKVLNEIKSYCNKENISKIIVQCAITKEMINFCLKNNRVFADYNTDGLGDIGDYILEI